MSRENHHEATEDGIGADEPRSRSRRGFWFWVQIVVVFAIGVWAGAGLIYSLQPSWSPPMLIYSIFLFASDEVVVDFAPHAEMMNRGVTAYVIGAKGPKYTSNVQLATKPGALTTLTTVIPSRFLRLPLRQGLIEIKGIQTNQGIRTTLKFHEGAVQSSHVFDLKQGFRAIELSTGGYDGDDRFYAIIQVEEATPMPSGPLTLPNPATRQPVPAR